MSSKKIGFKLMVITDCRLAGWRFERLMKSMIGCGVGCIQIREKDMPAKELLDLSRWMKQKASKTRTKIIINDRLDIALLSKANGVHSISNGIRARDIKKQRHRLIAGRSAHSLKEALKAESEGFDYILFGPVFRTPAKIKYGKPQGLAELTRICSSVKIPVFAVGGINPGRIEKCIEAGAYGVAAIRPFMTSQNIKRIIKDFESKLGSL